MPNRAPAPESATWRVVARSYDGSQTHNAKTFDVQDAAYAYYLRIAISITYSQGTYDCVTLQRNIGGAWIDLIQTRDDLAIEHMRA